MKSKTIRVGVLLTSIYCIFMFSAISQNIDATARAPQSSSIGSGLVDHLTGDFNYTLPITTLSDRGFNVPVSLSYTGSGILVEQPATEVGLGWSLNAGGYISRELRAYPDDQSILATTFHPAQVGWMYDFDTDPLSKKIADFQTIYSNDAEETAISTELIELLNSDPEIDGINYDTEPDIYTYNILGRTGSFVFGTKDENATSHPIVLIPYYPIKIDYEMSTDESEGLLWFKITDENGIEYLFEEREIIRTTIASVIDESITINNHLKGKGTNVQEYTSAWYLTKITNLFNQELVFTYESFKEYLDFSYYEECHNYERDDWEFDDLDNLTLINGSSPFTFKKLIKTIEGPITKVEFNYYEKRKDINLISSMDHPCALNEIIVSQNLGDIYNKTIKSYNFNYGYFEVPIGHYTTYFYNIYNNIDAATKRLRLDKITEFNGEASLPPVEFEYDYDLTNGRFLPSRYSFAKDIWGYNNMDAGNENSIPELVILPSEVESERFSLLVQYTGLPSEILNEGALMYPVPDYKKIGSLTKIAFPNGGNLSIEYESDEFRYSDHNTNYNGGGLRVKELTSSDGTTTEQVRSYEYTQFNNAQKSSGRITSLPVFGYIDPRSNDVTSLETDCIYVRTNVDLNTIDNEIVQYENVREIISNRGYIDHTYLIPGQLGELNDDIGGDGLFEVPSISYVRYPNDISNNVNTYTSLLSSKLDYPYLNNLNYDWNRGQLERIVVYNENHQVVKRTEFEYVIHYPNSATYQSVYGLKVGFLKNNQDELDDKLIAFGKYKIATEVSKKTLSKTVFHYDQANPFSSTFYYYNEDGFVAEVKTVDGNSQSTSTLFKYVLDYWRGLTIYSEPTETNALALFYMAVKNNIGRSIETTYLKNSKVTSAVVDIFRPMSSGTEIVVPSESWLLEVDAPIQDYTQSSISDPWLEFQFNANNFDKHTQFNNYDEKGNLLDANIVENLYNASIYGYKSTYPVATINNARNVDDPVGISCGYTGFESGNLDLTADNNYWQIGSYGEIDNTDAHTGLFSLKLNNISTRATWSTLRTFIPENQERTFEFSAWVKNESGMPDISAGIGYELYDMNDEIISGTWEWISFTDTHGEWKLISQTIDLEQIKSDLSITGDVKIKCYTVNYDATHYMLIDDIRFAPQDAFMTTYTYDPGVGVTSITDANNVTKHVLYDELGRTTSTLDFKGNTLNNVVYNFADNQLKISNRTYDFQEVTKNTSIVKSFIFSNSGTETITVNAKLLNSTDISLPDATDPTLGVDITLLPGESESLNVQFYPLDYGIQYETIEISSNDPRYNSKIYVKGTGSGVYFSTTYYEFPTWTAHGESANQSFNLYNRTSTPIDVTFSISGSSDFSSDLQNTTVNISSQSSLYIPIVFTPGGTTHGYRNAILTALIEFSDGSTETRTLGLKGYAYYNISFSVDCDSDYVNCQTSTPKYTYTLSDLSYNDAIGIIYTWYRKNCSGNFELMVGETSNSIEIDIFHDNYCYEDKFEVKCNISQFYSDYEEFGKSTSTTMFKSSPLANSLKCSDCF